MDLKKRKGFTPKKGTTLSLNEEKVNRLIKSYFLVSLFVSLFLFSNVGKIKLWLSSTIEQFDFKNICREKHVMETIISNNIKISSFFPNGRAEIHLE